jgi:hypothetical protein
MTRLATTGLVASLVLACSPANVGSPSDAGRSGVAEAGADAGAALQACTDYANARCNHLLACSQTAIQTRYGDVSVCVSSLRQMCMNAVAAPSSGSSAAGEEACAMHISDWTCNDQINSTNAPSQCQQVKGALAIGATCALSAQCQTGFCAIVPGAACGVCATAPKMGDSCANLTTCGEGVGCVLNACADYATIGAQCSAQVPCGAGLACVGATGMMPGTCQTAVATPGAQCVSSGAGCDYWAGLTCNSQSQQCETLMVVDPGGQCGYVNLQGTGCLDGVCVGNLGNVPGTCSQYGAVGGSCDLINGPPCFSPLRCILNGDGGTSGTCEFPDATRCQ